MKQECDVLRNFLKKAQDDITVLLDEKRRLLDTVRTLQVCIAFIALKSSLITINCFIFSSTIQQNQLVSNDRNYKNDGNR